MGTVDAPFAVLPLHTNQEGRIYGEGFALVPLQRLRHPRRSPSTVCFPWLRRFRGNPIRSRGNPLPPEQTPAAEASAFELPLGVAPDAPKGKSKDDRYVSTF